MTPLMLIVALAAGWTGWRYWKRAGAEGSYEAGGEIGRTRFMGASGKVLAGMFSLIILAEGVPVLFHDPCH